MSKLIIHVNGVDDAKALELVAEVVKGGLVSETSNGRQYCFLTTWKSGFVVKASKNNGNTHTFCVDKD